MNKFIPLTKSSLFRRAICILSMAILFVACTKDDSEKRPEKLIFEAEKYSVSSEDALGVVSDLPAYVVPYEYKDFGAALVNRLQNRAVELNEQTIEHLASLVLHSSQIESLED